MDRLDNVIKLTLISRLCCHLCHEMERAAIRLAMELDFEFEVLDVDADVLLEQRYSERVPVLLYAGVELCHYFLDEAKVRDLLREIR